MGSIVSAIRGGKASRINQQFAIKLALKESKPLVFLYIVDTQSIPELDEKFSEAAETELTWFGQALLKIAARRASRQGLKVEVEIRKGEVENAIFNLLREMNADTLVLGSPRAGDPNRRFSPPTIKTFAEKVKETGVEVAIVAQNE